jgi:hypothetical protein
VNVTASTVIGFPGLPVIRAMNSTIRLDTDETETTVERTTAVRLLTMTTFSWTAGVTG